MKQILIANLGNRNLKFNGELFTSKPGDDTGLKLMGANHSFRSFTKEILKRLQNGTLSGIDLQISILDSFLESNDNGFEKVYLICSNQVDETKQDQDTLWEAKIIKSIIEKEYHITTEIIEYTKNVTNNNYLLRFYRDMLHKLCEKHDTEKFIICDAGGTAQQKSSLKIATEFILDSTKFDVFYKPIDKDTLTRVDQYEYRKIIISEQIQSLISNGNYSAANSLLPMEDNPVINDLRCLLMFGDYRIHFLFNDISAIGKKRFSDCKVPQIIADYKNQKQFYNDDFRDIFLNDNEKHAFKISELFSIASFYLKIEKFSEFVMSLAVFIEQFFNEYASSHTNIDITSNNLENRLKMLRHIKCNYPDFQTGADLTKPMDINYLNHLSLPVTISFAKMVAKMDTNALAMEFINLLSSLNSNFNNCVISIDMLRNDIAHRGEGVKREELKRILDTGVIEKIESMIGILDYRPFDLLNNYIQKYIQVNL
nr:hypothetical protein [Bacteroidota bacterium]